MKNKKIKCDIYTRVSTTMQVDGYSLDAQKEKLKRYAEFQNKDYFYYACKHRRLVDGHKCGYRKQWSEEKINNAVEEVIRKLVKNPKFEEAILNKIG